jgi:lactate dehydrogenase-like 2-hydroxyacid dehydrogenase
MAIAKTREIRNIAIVGTGVIGASWAALFLARGLNVIATDPAPNAEANLCAHSIYLRRFRSGVYRTDVGGNAGSEPATPGAARNGTETSA